MADSSTPPSLYDISFLGVFADIAEQNPERVMAHLIRNRSDGSVDAFITWGKTVPYARNISTDMPISWWPRNNNKPIIDPRRSRGQDLQSTHLPSGGCEPLIDLIACLLDQWTALVLLLEDNITPIERLLRVSKPSLLIAERTGSSPKRLNLGDLTLTSTTIGASMKFRLLAQRSIVREELAEMRSPSFYLYVSDSAGRLKIIPLIYQSTLSEVRDQGNDRCENLDLPLAPSSDLSPASRQIKELMIITARDYVLPADPQGMEAIPPMDRLPFFNDDVFGYSFPLPITREICNLAPEGVINEAETMWGITCSTGGSELSDVGSAVDKLDFNERLTSGQVELATGTEEDRLATINGSVSLNMTIDCPRESYLKKHGNYPLREVKTGNLTVQERTRLLNKIFQRGTSVTRSPPLCSQSILHDRMRDCIARYSTNFQKFKPGSRIVKGKNVVLTGSTGSVGSSMLDILLRTDDVNKVYLLNRPGKESQENRQVKGFKVKGLDTSILRENKERIAYLNVDLSKKDLGLSTEHYDDIRDNATHIIHVAWAINFAYDLQRYEQIHIAGIRHLIDLALSSRQIKPPRLTYLSTIGAAMMYSGPTTEPLVGDRGRQCLVPEAPVDDPSMALDDQGYGQSKYVSERIIVNATESGLRATISRVGQLSGSTTNGHWASNEYPVVLFRSCLAMGIAPNDLPPFRWVPSDVAASALIKEAFHDSESLQYFSVENPFPTPWKVITTALSNISPKPLQFIPLSEWLDHIKRTNPDPKVVPAIKLVDFYRARFEGWPIDAAMGWDESIKVAPELAMCPITVKLVEKYIQYQIELEAQHRPFKL